MNNTPFLEPWKVEDKGDPFFRNVRNQLPHDTTLYPSRPEYTGRHRRNGPNFGRVFLMLNYTDITVNTYIQSWTVREIMAIEQCGLLWCPRTVSRPWRHIHPLRKPGNEKPLSNIGMQWCWRDNSQLLPASITWKPKANAKVVWVFL